LCIRSFESNFLKILKSTKNFFFTNNLFKNQAKLLYLELAFLFLMIFSLPSLEAPKNIFLVFFVILSVVRQSRMPIVWRVWDWMFLSIVLTAFLTTILAGLAPGDEWKGFRVLLTFIGVGWLISRSDYSLKVLSSIFWMVLLSAFPPLFFAFWETLILHSKDTLQLHSVGHVNHSAIYLTIIFGAFLGASLSLWRSATKGKKIVLFIFPVILYFSLLVGQSRAAFGVGTLIGIFFILLFAHKKKIGALTIIFFMLILIISSGAPIVQKQLNNQKNNDILAGRSLIWNTTIEAAKMYPWFGIGIDNRGVLTKDDIKNSIESRHESFDENQFNFHYKHSHSFYLTNISERGLVGAAVTLFFIFMWLRYLVKTFYITRLSNQGAYLWAGSASAWLATFGIGFVNTTFHHEHGILACLFLGLHLAFLNKKGLKLKRSF
jgi:O-antigen ligase